MWLVHDNGDADDEEDKLGLVIDNADTDDREGETWLVLKNGDTRDDKNEVDNDDQEDNLKNDDVKSEDNNDYCSKISDHCEYFLVHDSCVACLFTLWLAALIVASKSVLKYLLLSLKKIFAWDLSKNPLKACLSLAIALE